MFVSRSVKFCHAMVYVKDLQRSIDFYSLLGLEMVTAYDGYARLRFPAGDGTLALHEEEGRRVDAPGVRLYFEVEDLDGYCKELEAAGVKFFDPLAMRDWGWRHAYLYDPDGHEISLFFAGEERLVPRLNASQMP